MSVSVPADPDAALSEKAPAPRTLLGSRADVTNRLSRSYRGGLLPLREATEIPPGASGDNILKGAQFDHWNNRLDLRRLFGRVLAAFRARR